MVARFEIYLTQLDPVQGSEIRKTRPCVVISPDEMNQYLATVLISPMTTKGKSYVTRIPCTFDNKNGHIVLDQIRTVDKIRLVKRLGSLSDTEQEEVLTTLSQLFAR
ncbi:MAG: type II toxin-antitoxin system PemK/MazF family toxin [Chthonomonadaceae bacterium]|nr:type II toxin-antitoxin system PemK/MazF family toxin [Chthonomonadaceae bacterium]MBC7525956.1 type II toxin-antitoxin system PemK/MazF family toxin [Chthonomonadaceae bacterium]